MDLVFRSGRMEPSTRASGDRTRLMARASFGTLMVTFTRASGRTTKLTASASTSMSTAPSTRDTGRMTYKMAAVSSPGPTVRAIKVAIRKA